MMDPLGLIVLDDRIFLSRVVNRGTEQGIFTRDRADEIIRISVAMANKYVLQKEVDFRSNEELAKVQETILKLVGVGLELKSRGDVDEGVRVVMEESPVDLFRLAYTRVAKLRQAWKLLLEDHRVEILVSPAEYQCLDDLTFQRLSEMSIFTETELDKIQTTTLSDELFSTLAVVEYYESELERFRFILRLREILPFELLNKSRTARVENLAEVDSIREALVHTVIISGYVEGEDPLAVTMDDAREFLAALDPDEQAEVFPEDIENVLIDLIHELGEPLGDAERELLTKEILRLAENFVGTILNEWKTINSRSANTFFKRWSRLAILSDAPDPVGRILASDEPVDEFDFDILSDQLTNRSEPDALQLAATLPWNRLTSDQVIRLFQEHAAYQESFAANVSLEGFNAAELVDLLEVIDPEAFKKLTPALQAAMSEAGFTVEDLGLLAALPLTGIPALLRAANPPLDCDASEILAEFGEASASVRKILLYSCWGSELFPELVQEAGSVAPDFMNRFVKSIAPDEVGSFLEAAAGGTKPRVIKAGKKGKRLQFKSEDLTSLFDSLSRTKKAAAIKYFSKKS